MAYDADGNFYNPYSPGSYEYEMEESNRYQEPGTGGVVTVAQTPDILRVQQAAPPPGFNTFNQVTSIILSVATLSVPLLGEMIGAAILEGLGITGATAAVEAGVGAAALSAGSTAAQGGSFDDVLKNSATAGFATGINIGMGGGVAGAATGSFVGSAIQGGSVDQVLTNALAAGAGAGVQGILGPAAGTIVRDLIKTGEVSDRTLINAAVAELGSWNKAGDRKAPIVEGQPIAPPAEEEPVPTSISLDLTGQEPAPAATLPPVTVTAPTIAPTVTDVDVMKQVAAQQPTATLPPVTVTAKPEEQVAPTVTDIPEVRPDTTRGLPAPTAELPPVTVTAKREEEVAPTVTELPPVTVTGQPEPTYQLDPVTITGKREYELDPVTITGRREEEVAPTVTELPPVTITAPREPVYELPPVTVTGRREEEIAPTVTDIPPGATELPPVTVTAKRDEEPAPTITDIVAKTMEPPPAPPPPPAPEVKAEEPKKEEPKKEAKKLYPTVTSVSPPARPGRQPIITGASPARLLADALAAYRPAGAIEGEESGKERQNVWNEKSLRLKDALGL